MSTETGRFDPYHQWLDIAPSDQPPSHYRLLGLRDFEDDLDVICRAADDAISHVRSVADGAEGAVSQRLLSELAAARICLLDPQRKEDYDRSLRVKRGIESLPQRTQRQPRTQPAELPPESGANASAPSVGTSQKVRALVARRRARKRLLTIVAFVVMLTVLAALVVAAILLLRP